MRVSVGYGGGGMGAGMSEPAAQGGVISGFLAGLPSWASALAVILMVFVGAAIVGVIIGKMYASVKYPDPEKHSVLPPMVKIGFVCVIAVCSIWLFTTLTKQPKPDLPVDGGISDISEPSEAPDDGDGEFSTMDGDETDADAQPSEEESDDTSNAENADDAVNSTAEPASQPAAVAAAKPAMTRESPVT